MMLIFAIESIFETRNVNFQRSTSREEKEMFNDDTISWTISVGFNYAYFDFKEFYFIRRAFSYFILIAPFYTSFSVCDEIDGESCQFVNPNEFLKFEWDFDVFEMYFSFFVLIIYLYNVGGLNKKLIYVSFHRQTCSVPAGFSKSF